MIFPKKSELGRIRLTPRRALVAGERTTLAIAFTVGRSGLKKGARVRLGLPNTGWERPVVPQTRYWDELVTGKARRYAPFHAVNTTAVVKTAGAGTVALDVMERMLLPDEDPAEAYWRWWITVTVEEAALKPRDRIVVTYGDPRFVGRPARIQTFPENGLTLSAYVDPGDGNWARPAGAPVELDVIAGPPSRANIVTPSVAASGDVRVRVALTDSSHCRPAGPLSQPLVLRDGSGRPIARARIRERPVELIVPREAVLNGGITVTDPRGATIWGRSNPAVRAQERLNLYWGDLHAQSEYHVMHSQKKDARQGDWRKGISCGEPDDVYGYARDVSLLDFIAITDQGAITGIGWDILREKAAEYYRPGRFTTFDAYEAGSPVGHRNVIYRGVAADERQDSGRFSYLPAFLYDFYAGRRDVMMIPHHVKTWTDWSFYDPLLEPVMEVYSCWGQSENPSLARWDKGMTPGAGAWEALKRGYRLGIIASSDNHVGMPGRSFPHDRQVHTPFPGGLAAVWARELTREAVFDAVRDRRCYGTTGARIVLEFWVDGEPMGGEVTVTNRRAPRQVRVATRGTDAIASVEIVRNGSVIHEAKAEPGSASESHSFEWTDREALAGTAYYYVRVRQEDGEMAWSSPVWVELNSRS